MTAPPGTHRGRRRTVLVGPGKNLANVLDLPGFHLLHATCADLLVRLGRATEAGQAYDDALALVTNDAERAFLRQRRAEAGRVLSTTGASSERSVQTSKVRRSAT